MKKIKIIALVVLSSVALIAFAQAIKDVNSSVGNGDAMKTNLNEPNATSPARYNIQNHEVDGVVRDMNNHPEKDLANSYNRFLYEEKKK
jgi:hypothetical protein